jgi:hypothetical protein
MEELMPVELKRPRPPNRQPLWIWRARHRLVKVGVFALLGVAYAAVFAERRGYRATRLFQVITVLANVTAWIMPSRRTDGLEHSQEPIAPGRGGCRRSAG